MNNFDDGKYYAATLGQFVGLLVDGRDVAVRFRVVKDGEHDAQGRFTRLVECMLIPDGHVMDTIEDNDNVHKTLLALLEAGVVM